MMDWKPPIYVLINLNTMRPIGFYAITEADRLEDEAEEYLAKHPDMTRKDIGITLDKWGFNLPLVDKIPDWM